LNSDNIGIGRKYRCLSTFVPCLVPSTHPIFAPNPWN